MLSPVDNFQYGFGGAIRNIGQPSLLFMKSAYNLGFTNWLAFYPELGGGEGLVVFTNYDVNAEPAGSQTCLLRSSRRAKVMSWPSFLLLQDSDRRLAVERIAFPSGAG